MIDSGVISKKALSLVGCGYIMGATGWICTEKLIEQQAKQYPAYADMIHKYGPKWLGKRCFDCAQLTREAAKAAGINLPSGATSQWRANIWAEKGTIDTLPMNEPDIQLWREDKNKPGTMAHTGIYCGDGTAVEARGHAYGVQRRDVSAAGWTHWARHADGALWSDPDAGNQHDTVRKGASGGTVVEVQGLLMRAGYPLPLYGADGKFGNETDRAVKDFQAGHGLMIDGVVGPATWAALMRDAPDPADDEPDIRYTVTIKGATEAEMTELLEWFRDIDVKKE